jgi:hypothetical protein
MLVVRKLEEAKENIEDDEKKTVIVLSSSYMCSSGRTDLLLIIWI